MLLGIPLSYASCGAVCEAIQHPLHKATSRRGFRIGFRFVSVKRVLHLFWPDFLFAGSIRGFLSIEQMNVSVKFRSLGTIFYTVGVS